MCNLGSALKLFQRTSLFRGQGDGEVACETAAGHSDAFDTIAAVTDSSSHDIFDLKAARRVAAADAARCMHLSYNKHLVNDTAYSVKNDDFATMFSTCVTPSEPPHAC